MLRRTRNKIKFGIITAAAALTVAAPAAPAVAAPVDVQPMGLSGPYSTVESCEAARERHPQYPHVGECEFTAFGPGIGWWWGFYS